MTRTDALTARFFNAARTARFVPRDAWNHKTVIDTRNGRAVSLVREILGDELPSAERLAALVGTITTRCGCRASEATEILRVVQSRVTHTIEVVAPE